MSNENEGFKAGFGCLLGTIAIFFITAIIIGTITGKTDKLVGKATNASGTLIWVVISGFIIVGFMRVMSHKK